MTVRCGTPDVCNCVSENDQLARWMYRSRFHYRKEQSTPYCVYWRLYLQRPDRHIEHGRCVSSQIQLDNGNESSRMCSTPDCPENWQPDCDLMNLFFCLFVCFKRWIWNSGKPREACKPNDVGPPPPKTLLVLPFSTIYFSYTQRETFCRYGLSV